MAWNWNTITKNMPTPAEIERQKDQYNGVLDRQLKDGIETIEEQYQTQVTFMREKAQQHKAAYTMQMDMEVKAQEGVLEQERQHQIMLLQQNMATKKSVLEQQTMRMSMEWQQRKAEQEMVRSQYEMDKRQNQMTSKLEKDMNRLGLDSISGQQKESVRRW